MLLWYRTLAYLALHREANLILSNGKVTALPTVFNPVVKLARTEAYRQERAASSTKLFTRQSSKLDKMHMEFGMSQEFIATYSQLQEASPKGGGRKRQASSRQCQEAALFYTACWVCRPRAHHQAGHATRRTKHFRESLPLLLAAFHCKLSSFNQNTGICMFE